MSGRVRSLSVILGTGLLGLARAAVAGDTPSAGSAADVARCAAIVAPDERLACYDALAKGKPSQAQGSTPDSARPAGGSDEKGFGLFKRQLPAPQATTQIKALVTEVSVDRLGIVSVSLDNGQSWTFNDPDARIRSGDAVTIRRGALGSFLMTTPSRHTYRVQRTK